MDSRCDPRLLLNLCSTGRGVGTPRHDCQNQDEDRNRADDNHVIALVSVSSNVKAAKAEQDQFAASAFCLTDAIVSDFSATQEQTSPSAITDVVLPGWTAGIFPQHCLKTLFYSLPCDYVHHRTKKVATAR
jgi:hypothetical protein